MCRVAGLQLSVLPSAVRGGLSLNELHLEVKTKWLWWVESCSGKPQTTLPVEGLTVYFSLFSISNVAPRSLQPSPDSASVRGAAASREQKPDYAGKTFHAV